METNTLKTEKKAIEATNSSLQKELAQQQEFVKEKDKSIAEFEKKITDFQLDVEEIQVARNAAKNEGIRTYCKTFLAGDPNYD